MVNSGFIRVLPPGEDYARRSLSTVPTKDIGASPMRRFANKNETSTSTEMMLGDPTPSEGKHAGHQHSTAANTSTFRDLKELKRYPPL